MRELLQKVKEWLGKAEQQQSIPELTIAQEEQHRGILCLQSGEISRCCLVKGVSLGRSYEEGVRGAGGEGWLPGSSVFRVISSLYFVGVIPFAFLKSFVK